MAAIMDPIPGGTYWCPITDPTPGGTSWPPSWTPLSAVPSGRHSGPHSRWYLLVPPSRTPLPAVPRGPHHGPHSRRYLVAAIADPTPGGNYWWPPSRRYNTRSGRWIVATRDRNFRGISGSHSPTQRTMPATRVKSRSSCSVFLIVACKLSDPRGGLV